MRARPLICPFRASPSAVKFPCVRAFLFPLGAPPPAPCILQTLCPRTAGDRQGFPLRFDLAWHRNAWRGDSRRAGSRNEARVRFRLTRRVRLSPCWRRRLRLHVWLCGGFKPCQRRAQGIKHPWRTFKQKVCRRPKAPARDKEFRTYGSDRKSATFERRRSPQRGEN
jgi:hypothetical protein